METKIIVYKNLKEAQHDINIKVRRGWEVVSIQQNAGRQGVAKSLGIGTATGLVAGPLAGIAAGALFGKKADTVTVIYNAKSFTETLQELKAKKDQGNEDKSNLKNDQ